MKTKASKKAPKTVSFTIPPLMITRSRGGTQERKVKLDSLLIPDIWGCGMPDAIECWRIAHDLKRELIERHIESVARDASISKSIRDVKLELRKTKTAIDLRLRLHEQVQDKATLLLKELDGFYWTSAVDAVQQALTDLNALSAKSGSKKRRVARVAE